MGTPNASGVTGSTLLLPALNEEGLLTSGCRRVEDALHFGSSAEYLCCSGPVVSRPDSGTHQSWGDENATFRERRIVVDFLAFTSSLACLVMFIASLFVVIHYRSERCRRQKLSRLKQYECAAWKRHRNS